MSFKCPPPRIEYSNVSLEDAQECFHQKNKNTWKAAKYCKKVIFYLEQIQNSTNVSKAKAKKCLEKSFENVYPAILLCLNNKKI